MESERQPGLIEVRDAAFGYPTGGFSLRVPELRIEAERTVAVTGPSGSGKTTLVNLLAGILSPSSGSIVVCGLDLTELGEDDRQDLRILKLGLVFQEFELLDYLDVLDNILLPYRMSPVLELDRAARERAVALAEDVGLGGKVGRFPSQLSQGERQRVAVARALVTRPSIVFGDEPTGNLDVENRDHVADTLFRYTRETGAPLVVVSHDLELVARFSRELDVTELA